MSCRPRARSPGKQAIHRTTLALSLLGWLPAAPAAEPLGPDPRLREITYPSAAVVTVPVKRGVVTLIQLGDDEVITNVASGLGADCSKPEASWCIAAQPGGRSLFVKPKSAAGAPNNLAVITDKRSHSFRFTVLADHDPKPPLYRLRVQAPRREAPSTRQPPAPWPQPLASLLPFANLANLPELSELPNRVAERLKAKPLIHNAQYALATGPASDDLVPTLVFDDGRFTYLRYPPGQAVPAVFEVLGDGSETLVNTHMDADLLVVDRVARQLMLRAGQAAVGIWNDAFTSQGLATETGSTVPGLRRRLIAPRSTDASPDPRDKRGLEPQHREPHHD